MSTQVRNLKLTDGVNAMAWIYLIMAGLMEIVWAIGLKKSEGFLKFWPSVWTISAMIVSFALLGMALRKLPVGTAYAIWTGIGAVGVAAYGIMFMDESRDWMRLLSILFIVTGIVGLKLAHQGQ